MKHNFICCLLLNGIFFFFFNYYFCNFRFFLLSFKLNLNRLFCYWSFFYFFVLRCFSF